METCRPPILIGRYESGHLASCLSFAFCLPSLAVHEDACSLHTAVEVGYVGARWTGVFQRAGICWPSVFSMIWIYIPLNTRYESSVLSLTALTTPRGLLRMLACKMEKLASTCRLY